MDTSTQGYSRDVQGRLKFLLEKRKHSVYRMAKEAKVGYATVYGLVNGTRKNPELETLEKLADAYNVTVAWLTGVVTLQPDDLSVDSRLDSLEVTVDRGRTRVGEVREGATAYGETSARAWRGGEPIDWPGEPDPIADELDKIVAEWIPRDPRTSVRQSNDRQLLLSLRLNVLNIPEIPPSDRRKLVEAIDRRLDATPRRH